MNTKMLMLGILLLAGLSFAVPAECAWAAYANHRYSCNFEISYDGWMGEGGYLTLAQYLADGDEEYDQYLENMALYLYGTGPEDPSMWQGLNGMQTSTCTVTPPYYVPTAFRTYMAEYNSYSGMLKSEFNAFLRLYLVNNPGSRSEVLGYLSDISADYRNCISPSST